MLENLRLWRIHYPVDQIAAGGCVFGEYEGYIDLNYQDGSLPGTPAEEVISVLRLAPKTGGSSQTFVFAGTTHFEGAPQLWDPATAAFADVPDGGLPSPVCALWKPVLEPDREYCATLTLYGRNLGHGQRHQQQRVRRGHQRHRDAGQRKRRQALKRLRARIWPSQRFLGTHLAHAGHNTIRASRTSPPSVMLSTLTWRGTVMHGFSETPKEHCAKSTIRRRIAKYPRIGRHTTRLRTQPR